jgi:indolepyruvate ferredoxin oxidoreductase alpha subunit
MKKRITKGVFVKNPGMKVTLPAVSRNLHRVLLEKIDQASGLAEASPYNLLQGRGRWGVITSGVSYNYVMDALSDLSLKGRVAVLRLGFTHPFPKNKVQRFLRGKDKVLVVEELEPYLEEETKAAAQEAGLTLEIRGKSKDLFSRLFELNPGLVRDRIAVYFGVKQAAARPIQVSALPAEPARPPNLCPGCPHRSTFFAVKKVSGEDMVYPTDIGCYTLGFMPPLRAADFLLCMGSSISTACGISRATGRKTVAFIGDSTFFHGGMTGLVNAVHNKHDVLLMILDNGTTAMTGHQIHPGVDTAPLGRDLKQVRPESVVRGLGVENVQVIQPRNLKKMEAAVRSALERPGVSVIVSEEVCPLYARRIGRMPKRPVYMVDQERCRNHRDCLNLFACPAFYLEAEEVRINPDLCVGCAVCSQVCPEHAIRPVKQGASS